MFTSILMMAVQDLAALAESQEETAAAQMDREATSR